jgi:hypothetical protein
MAISEQQRQKKLAKKKQKRSVSVKKVTPAMTKAQPYAKYPIHECLIPEDLFSSGLGELVVARRTPSGDIAFSAFVIDVFCLGVKDAMFLVMSEDEYEQRIKVEMIRTADRTFEKIHQSSAKLLDGLLNYSKELGFMPHPDCKNAYDIFGDIDASVSPEKYSYGKEGKPFYMNGPYESEADSKRILNTLTKSCGVDGFDTLVLLGDMEDDFM